MGRQKGAMGRVRRRNGTHYRLLIAAFWLLQSTEMPDVIVIGGGPAGSASAIRLAGLGLSVRLYEKARFPRAKLCGGFLSAEALPEFEDLGVGEDLKNAGVCWTRRVLISSPHGAQAVADLSRPAVSLSRYRLDQVLLERARASGVEVVEETDGWPHREEADWIIDSTGRHPPSSLRSGGARKPFYGFQASFDDVSGITDQVELDMIPGGYVGLVRQDDAVNVSGLVDLATLRRIGPDLDQAIRSFMTMNPLLNDRLRGARRRGAWKTVGPIVTGLRTLVNERVVFVGDAACVVDPFAGEGLAMGLIGARLLQEAFVRKSDERAAFYQEQWHRRFDRPLRVQRILSWGIERVWGQEALTRGCRLFPGLMQWFTEATRPPAFLASPT